MLKCQSILESMKEYLLFMGTAMFLECMALLSFTNLENYQPLYLKYCLWFVLRLNETFSYIPYFLTFLVAFPFSVCAY